jgi:hypothetical protein
MKGRALPERRLDPDPAAMHLNPATSALQSARLMRAEGLARHLAASKGRETRFTVGCHVP